MNKKRIERYLCLISISKEKILSHFKFSVKLNMNAEIISEKKKKSSWKTINKFF
jgi:hypothetical protein